MIHILLIGYSGQVGKELQEILKKNKTFNIHTYNSANLDITNFNKVNNEINRIKPSIIINAAAYTNVEKSESNKKAFKVNAEAVGNLAKVAHENDAYFIHISTDYVFGNKKSGCYSIGSPTKPINKYGQSKLMGENLIKKYCEKYFIIRTSWVYGIHGGNFVQTIIDNANNESLNVVNDQQSSPTSASSLSHFIYFIIGRINQKNPPKNRILHFSNLGRTSWYFFAREIIKISFDLGIIENKPKIIAVNSDSLKTQARRPNNSKLRVSKFIDFRNYFWKDELRKQLLRIKNLN